MISDNRNVRTFYAIYNIADVNYQRTSWKGNHPYLASSFIEDMNTLYDDLEFEEYLNSFKHTDNNKTVYQAMIKLNKAIKEYKEPDSTDKILNDPKWKEINNLANNIITAWIDSIF